MASIDIFTLFPIIMGPPLQSRYTPDEILHLLPIDNLQGKSIHTPLAICVDSPIFAPAILNTKTLNVLNGNVFNKQCRENIAI